MRIHHAAWLAPFLLVSACASRPETTGERLSAEGSASSTDPPGADEACTTRRWIGATSATDGTCPSAVQLPVTAGGQWQSSFALGASPPPGMARLCEYDWVPDPGSTTDGSGALSALPKDVDSRLSSEWLSPDCHVVAALAAGMSEASYVDVARQLAAQADALPSLPKGKVAPSPIEVAVVDSSPDSVGGPITVGALLHGYSLARLIENLSCPSGGVCVGKVSTYLGLPDVTPDHPDFVRGGFFGTQQELAVSLRRAVDDYRVAVAKGGPVARLVVNLSVGWEPTWGGRYAEGAPTSLPGPALAVQSAIVHASCYGAIVVAAAGNQGGESSIPGPMFPGGWEAQAAPSPAECEAFEGAGFDKDFARPILDSTPGRPLVYAAGGVDGGDQPLASTRPLGRPTFAAPAQAGIGVTEPGDSYVFPGHPAIIAASENASAVLTGTSVAAAVVSATAAAVWGYRPELRAAEVMAIVRGAGVSLSPAPDGSSPTADFCAAPPCPEIVRTDLCAALRSACSGGATTCPSSAIKCAAHGAYSAGVSAPPAASLAELADAEPIDVYVGEPGAPIDLADACDETYIPPPPGAPASDPCPERHYASSYDVPWIGPQPNVPTCPSCPFVIEPPRPGNTTPAIAYVFVEQPGLYLSPILELRSPGRKTIGYDLSAAFPSGLVGQTRYRVRGITLPEGAIVEAPTASLSSLVSSPETRTFATVSSLLSIETSL